MRRVPRKVGKKQSDEADRFVTRRRSKDLFGAVKAEWSQPKQESVVGIYSAWSRPKCEVFLSRFGRHWAFCVVCALLMFLSSGCASRKPVASRRAAPSPEAAGASANTSSAPGASRSRRYKMPATPVPVGYTEEGNASWYGEPFHGRRASNGEIYDMNKLTAAHRTLPFDTTVRVTNLNNGKFSIVRITDRGPFVSSRIIDLSKAAAREIESIGPGVVPVRIEVLSIGSEPSPGYFTVQVGAFHDRKRAEVLRDRLLTDYSPIFIRRHDSGESVYYRVFVGKIPTEESAQEFGERLRDREGFTPMVIRMDEEAPPAGGNE